MLILIYRLLSDSKLTYFGAKFETLIRCFDLLLQSKFTIDFDSWSHEQNISYILFIIIKHILAVVPHNFLCVHFAGIAQ